ncbi:unnamed protein product [Rotaria sordida]|uniref:Uncharacterized protein n=1 Tax=Rotaria sordida TaxID=392033 RepID=A0A815TML4_9BILA|nr:unnamed protein product [Rotaria sordida]CAF1508122.1 unnamed protein product [Rotaria sordida]
MIEETMPDYDISSHFIYSIAKFLVMLSHDTLHSKQDQSLLDIYSTQLTLFDVVSSFKLRPIDPFVVAFRASTIRNVSLFLFMKFSCWLRDETFSEAPLRVSHDVITRIFGK